ncbi:fungal-specific transcription factor domain-containing protein [Roridomyces roridus]|uniref:Fungal-specific transcription factor domain-containing protein n=1 Tax=Roridomyces roridus TaxID=1738132 RepID=A0AAD7FB85_9AGAR|nr:fungal-specific transcription factor domain-containing protein [Roridomyces roridus]
MPSVPTKEKTRKKPGRVATSCAECRRLKLRCDKNVPCGKCVSRGCGSICPDGHLTSGKGNRLVLANTEELHDRIENLCGRIRELEDALRALQETVSDRPHPLLRTDLLHLKSRSQPATGGPSPVSSEQSTLVDEFSDPAPRSEEENFIDSFGTLTIGLHGEGNFLGQTARSEYLFRALSKTPFTPVIPPPRLSRRIIELSCNDSDVVDQELGQEIYEHLPPLSEALTLMEVYLEHGAYLPTNLERKELLDGVLEVVYRAGSFQNLKSHQTLPLLFGVFATAALLDPKRPPYSMESREYYYLARAALSIASPMREATIPAIQALIHMVQYLDLSDWEGSSSNSAWLYIGTAIRLAYGIGLHLDSSRWSLCDDWGQQRRRVFWQLFIADSCLSFSLGRPASLSTPYVDASYPDDTQCPGDVPVADRDKEIGYFLWMCKYSNLMQSVSTAFGAKPPSYSTVLSLDRKIRDFYVPVHLRPNCGQEIPSPGLIRKVQRFLILTAKENTLLNLHRPYFTQALQDKPDDLANHRFIPSVMAAYRSAWRLIRSLVIIWKDAPQLIARVGSAWSPALSAAIVMCILVTRSPTSKMTKSSLEELDTLSRLFMDASASNRFAAYLQQPITNLAAKAHRAVGDDACEPTACEVTPADLDRLGGKTHLIHPLTPDSNMVTTPDPSSSSSSSSSSPMAFTRVPGMFTDSIPIPSSAGGSSGAMHPTIAQDMRSFELGEPSQFYDTFQLGMSEHYAGTGTGTGGVDPSAGSQNNVFSPNPGAFGYGMPVAFGTMGGAGGGTPPMLDATWQSFVEQLGF